MLRVMEDELRSHLITCATAYAAAMRLSTTTVGRLAVNDWRFFDRMADGAGFTVAKYDEVMRWFDANWPPAADWPQGVPRQTAEAAA
ncbi:MAG TPA: hypothetical protein DIV82_00505 [Brevundimonas diminuta]|jgi:hypothetical protein|nr:hypothetical protein [Brevundimonas diminuta]